jgi:2-oxoacid:acceptor oxidoreductase delta subunit (pyruvate/2-ketoisovalerate family)
VVDSDRCIACGICEKHCPTDVMTVATVDSRQDQNGRDDCAVSIDFDYCKGCGICANVCPKNAITMIDERKAANE